MESWDEIRTAYQVARVGTVSGAAEALGVHHATVIRHVDALEGRLGTKLFQRHARGYTPTEAGADLLRVAGAADDQLTQLASRIKGAGEGVRGELTVTSLALISRPVTAAMVALQAGHPQLRIRYLTDERLLKLEYGEAHVAIRAGPRPSEPDNVVQPFGSIEIGLYASEAYAAAHGLPESEEDLAAHRFVTLESATSRAPFARWLRERVPEDALRFAVSDHAVVAQTVAAGAGLGFVAAWEAEALGCLRVALSSRPEWRAPLWLVTHVDLHRSAKVQAALSALKEASETWPGFERARA